MNNTLDISRLGKVLRRDGLNYFHNMGLTFLIILSIPLIIFLYVSLTPGEHHIINTSTRIGIINVLKTIILVLAPAQLYKTCNDSRQGIGYAMLPASTLEKFISMVFYCVIVTPILYICSSLVVDSILALFNGPYEGFAITSYFDDNKLLRDYTNNAISFDGYEPESFIGHISPFKYYAAKVLSILTISSVFMFGNMIFKKRKTAKVIGVLVLIYIILSLISINYAIFHEEWFRNLKVENFNNYFMVLYNINIVINIILSSLLLFGVYRKIKTQKY